MATELAPQGSLFSLLEKRREVIQTQQGETAVSQIPKMPGGVFGYEITARISIQVSTMYVISVCMYVYTGCVLMTIRVSMLCVHSCGVHVFLCMWCTTVHYLHTM